MTEESEMKASYFEQLYQADPPVDGLDVRGVTIPIADPPIKCDPPSFLKTGCGEPVAMGVKFLGSVASMLNFARLVEMLNSCRCMQFCALPGTQASPN